MVKLPSDAELRTRFQELTAELLKLRAPIDKMEKERNAFQAQFEPKLREMNEKIKEARRKAGLYEKEQERARIARALGGKTG